MAKRSFLNEKTQFANHRKFTRKRIPNKKFWTFFYSGHFWPFSNKIDSFGSYFFSIKWNFHTRAIKSHFSNYFRLKKPSWFAAYRMHQLNKKNHFCLKLKIHDIFMYSHCMPVFNQNVIRIIIPHFPDH